MEMALLMQQLENLKTTLFNEEVLEEEQYNQVFKLTNYKMTFVSNILNHFLGDAENALFKLKTMLEGNGKVNFRKMEHLVFKIKGASHTVGGKRAGDACIPFMQHISKRDIAACRGVLSHLEKEFDLLKYSLESVLKLEKDVVSTAMAGGPSSLK